MKRILTVLSLAAVLTSVSCTEIIEEKPKVKLQNDAESEYVIDASDPEPIEILVRSLNHSWEMTSEHPEWCTIVPSNGDKAEIYTVKVQYKPNMALDDREDKLSMISDGVVGKEITVLQSGLAIAPSVDGVPENIDRNGSETSFTLSTNQNWTAKVTEGASWLSIRSGGAGTPQRDDFAPEKFTVTLAAGKNSGEARTGVVTIYDRNGKETVSVEVTQDEALLEPEAFELYTLYNDVQVTLNVDAEAKWKAVKDDASDTWYSLEDKEYDGKGAVTVNLTPNEGNGIRTATFTLTTVTDDETMAIRRTITLKQGPEIIRHYFKNGLGILTGGDPTISDEGATFKAGTNVSAANLKTGSYKFKFRRETQDAAIRMFYIFNESGKTQTEFRWHINADKTAMSTTPWYDFSKAQAAIDKTDTQNWHEMSMVMTEAEDGYMNATWNLDGKDLITICTDKILSATQAPALWNAPMTLQFGSGGGSVTFEWYECPFEWENWQI